MGQQEIYAAATALYSVSAVEAAPSKTWWQTPAPGSTLATAGVGRYLVDSYNDTFWYEVAAPVEPEPEPEPTPEPPSVEAALREIAGSFSALTIVAEADDVDVVWRSLPENPPAILVEQGVQAFAVDGYIGDAYVLIGDPTPPTGDALQAPTTIEAEAASVNAAAVAVDGEQTAAPRRRRTSTAKTE